MASRFAINLRKVFVSILSGASSVLFRGIMLVFLTPFLPAIEDNVNSLKSCGLGACFLAQSLGDVFGLPFPFVEVPLGHQVSAVRSQPASRGIQSGCYPFSRSLESEVFSTP